jgi:AcrR family transcriptional regulator
VKATGEGPESRPRRDSAASKGRLLAAAADEFAARGIAGARVDRIASAARANKRLIYDYFGDKDGLFDAMVDANMDKVIEANPMDASDLPGYAGRWFDYSREHPDEMRLFDWARLERRLGPIALGKRTQNYRRRLAAIDAAQREGTVSARLSPEQILMVIESLCVGWLSTTPPFLAAADQHTPEHRNPQPLFGNEEALSRAREVIVDTVRQLIAK